jgi:hypothetical protein
VVTIGALDFIWIVFLALTVTWGVMRQTVGMLLTLAGFWIAVTLAGVVNLLLSGAQGLGMRIMRALGSTSGSIRLLQVILFTVVSLGVLAIYHWMLQLSLEQDQSYPAFGVVDNILGGLLGAVFGVLFVAVATNVLRLSVSVPGLPYGMAQTIRTLYQTSYLAPYLLRLLAAFRPIFFIFLATGYPTPLSLIN